MSAISSQQQQLKAALKNEGWHVVDRTTDLDWWADEVWTIESEWRPTGLQVFVTFLVDPYPYSHNRRKGEGVWAVQCTSSWPSSEDKTNIAEVSLKHWDKQLVELMGHLSRFRDVAATS